MPKKLVSALAPMGLAQLPAGNHVDGNGLNLHVRIAQFRQRLEPVMIWAVSGNIAVGRATNVVRVIPGSQPTCGPNTATGYQGGDELITDGANLGYYSV